MIPVRAEELTPEFFESSLRKRMGDDLRVVCADVRPAFPVKMGFLATHIKATVVVTPSKSSNRKLLLSLFMKLVPIEDGFFMDFLTSERFDIREVQFFEDVATDLAKYLSTKTNWTLPIPRLAFSDHTSEEPKSILVLYDSSEEGFKPRSLSVGWDLPHLLVGVRSLAKFHASSVSYMVSNGLDVQAMEKKYPKLRFNPLCFTGTLEFRRTCVDALIEVLKTFDEGKQGDEDALLANLESVKSWDVDYITGRYKKGLEGPFVGVAHRDCWNNNFMFKYDAVTGEPSDAMLCDWQWAGLFNVTADLATLMYSSVDADLRSKCLNYVLKEYFRAFTHVLESLGTKVPDVDFETFEASYYDVGVHSAFELMRVLRISFSKSDAEFPGNPIMRRMAASFREMLRCRLERKLW
jgi:hypothetical protein